MTIRNGDKSLIFVFIADNDKDAEKQAENWAKQARVNLVYTIAIGDVKEPAFVCDRPEFFE